MVLACMRSEPLVFVIVASLGHFACLALMNSRWGTTEVRYFDSLGPSDGNGTARAARTLLRGLSLGDLPANCARKFQTDAWSCGIHCVNFIGKSIWSWHEEPSPWTMLFGLVSRCGFGKLMFGFPGPVEPPR